MSHILVPAYLLGRTGATLVFQSAPAATPCDALARTTKGVDLLTSIVRLLKLFG